MPAGCNGRPVIGSQGASIAIKRTIGQSQAAAANQADRAGGSAIALACATSAGQVSER